MDARGAERTMRISHHPERGVFVLSLWAGATCRASFQLPFDEVARLSDLLGTVPIETAGGTGGGGDTGDGPPSIKRRAA